MAPLVDEGEDVVDLKDEPVNLCLFYYMLTFWFKAI